MQLLKAVIVENAPIALSILACGKSSGCPLITLSRVLADDVMFSLHERATPMRLQLQTGHHTI